MPNNLLPLYSLDDSYGSLQRQCLFVCLSDCHTFFVTLVKCYNNIFYQGYSPEISFIENNTIQDTVKIDCSHESSTCFLEY